MVELIKYEWKKIMRRKAARVTMAAGVILTVVIQMSIIWGMNAYEKDGTRVTGLSAIALKKQQVEAYGGVLTEEKIAEHISRFQELMGNPENLTAAYDGSMVFNEDMYWSFYIPGMPLYIDLLANNYLPLNSGNDRNGEILMTVDLTHGPGFYETRQKKISQFLSMPHGAGNYSGAEQAYWLAKNDRVEAPYSFGFYDGWIKILLMSVEWQLLFIVICICVAPVFSSEYQTGADAVLLTCKYGKNRLVTAKLATALLFGMAYFILNAILSFGILLMAFGTDGWNMPIQLLLPMSPYPWTFLQASLVAAGIAFVVMLGLLCLTLFMSARFRSSFGVLIVDIFIILMPNFISNSATAGWFNKLITLLPARASDIRKVLAAFMDIQIGPVVMDILTVTAVVYGMITIVTLLGAGRGFGRHQVG